VRVSNNHNVISSELASTDDKRGLVPVARIRNPDAWVTVPAAVAKRISVKCLSTVEYTPHNVFHITYAYKVGPTVPHR
jgi:hypothetical protein